MRALRRARPSASKGLIGRSSIVVLASHSEDLIRRICNRAILLDHGRVVARRADRGSARNLQSNEQGRRRRDRGRHGRTAVAKADQDEPLERARGLNRVARHRHQRSEEAMSPVKHVKIFADGADIDGILTLYKNPLIKGFTTNPTLMRKAGIEDYEDFARRLDQGGSGPADLVRGFRRRFRRDDRARPRDRVVGRQRQRENPGHHHQGRVHRPGDLARSPMPASSSTSPRS